MSVRDKDIRKIKESPWEQGTEEVRPYRLTTTPWGGTPSNVVVKLYDGAALTDVSATKLTGAASISGDDIITPAVTGLADGHQYRLEIKFTVGGRTEEAYGWIVGKR